MRVGRILTASLASLVAGAVAFTAVQLAHSPGMWTHMDSRWGYGLMGTVIYALIPIAVLASMAMLNRLPSTAVCVSISVCWLLLIFGLWAAKPIRVYGEFPWWSFRRHFLSMLPIPLCVGLVFSVLLRRQ